ncbi:MAG TPA: FHA domain-containing protein, partial [Ktedonobacteraceae bacterium]|nr:FHA domain-containing protein [Ktedonobacteraceae bacterium]
RFPNAGALLEALEALPIRHEPGHVSAGPPAGFMTTEDQTVMSSDAQVKDVALENTHIVDGKKAYAYLLFEDEGQERRTFAITSKYVVVGRVDPKRGLKPEVDLTAIDPGMTVSRQHARIRYEKTFFSIEDLKSRNKTQLGKLTLTPMKAELLRDGDVLRFGSVRVIFRASDPG